MSTSESDNELTVSAALAANKQKTARKSAKGRKLMRWGPDEDQQLLLATEAVIIEGTVELDWNLVGEKMPQKVTGEAIKQHLYKVREARESAGMPTPAKAKGKSAFGSRRGVTRYPPVDPNANLTAKKKARPEPKKGRGKGKKVKAEGEELEEQEEDDNEFTEKKPKTPSKIKHRSLLFGPAVPKDQNSPVPTTADTELTIKLSTKKRKFKEEPEDTADAVATPKAPRKRAKKVKISPEAAVSGETQSPIKKIGRSGLPSNFDFPTRQQMLGHLAARKAVTVASSTKEINADVRKYSKPTAEKEIQAKPTKIDSLVDTPAYTERALRTKSTRPDYREGKASLSDDGKSELSEVEVNADDDMYVPEGIASDEVEHINTAKQESLSVEYDADMLVDDYTSPSQFEALSSSKPQQLNLQPHNFLQPTIAGDSRWPAENSFVEMPGFLRQDAANFPIDPTNYFNFNAGEYAVDPIVTGFPSILANPTDEHALYSAYDQVQQPASYQWGSLDPYLMDNTLLEEFGSRNNSFPQYNEDDVVVGKLHMEGAQEGTRQNEGQMQEGGQNLGVYNISSFNGHSAYDLDDYEVMQ